MEKMDLVLTLALIFTVAVHACPVPEDNKKDHTGFATRFTELSISGGKRAQQYFEDLKNSNNCPPGYKAHHMTHNNRYDFKAVYKQNRKDKKGDGNVVKDMGDCFYGNDHFDNNYQLVLHRRADRSNDIQMRLDLPANSSLTGRALIKQICFSTRYIKNLYISYNGQQFIKLDMDVSRYDNQWNSNCVSPASCDFVDLEKVKIRMDIGFPHAYVYEILGEVCVREEQGGDVTEEHVETSGDTEDGFLSITKPAVTTTTEAVSVMSASDSHEMPGFDRAFTSLPQFGGLKAEEKLQQLQNSNYCPIGYRPHHMTFDNRDDFRIRYKADRKDLHGKGSKEQFISNVLFGNEKFDLKIKRDPWPARTNNAFISLGLAVNSTWAGAALIREICFTSRYIKYFYVGYNAEKAQWDRALKLNMKVSRWDTPKNTNCITPEPNRREFVPFKNIKIKMDIGFLHGNLYEILGEVCVKDENY